MTRRQNRARPIPAPLLEVVKEETEEERVWRLARMCERLYLTQPMPDDVYLRLLDAMAAVDATPQQCITEWRAQEARSERGEPMTDPVRIQPGTLRNPAGQPMDGPSSKIQPGDGDPRHGTVNGYRNLKCRCDQCRDANTKHQRDYRSSRPPTVGDLSPELLARLQAAADERLISPQLIVERAVAKFLDALPPIAEVLA